MAASLGSFAPLSAGSSSASPEVLERIGSPHELAFSPTDRPFSVPSTVEEEIDFLLSKLPMVTIEQLTKLRPPATCRPLRRRMYPGHDPKKFRQIVALTVDAFRRADNSFTARKFDPASPKTHRHIYRPGDHTVSGSSDPDPSHFSVSNLTVVVRDTNGHLHLVMPKKSDPADSGSTKEVFEAHFITLTKTDELGTRFILQQPRYVSESDGSESPIPTICEEVSLVSSIPPSPYLPLPEYYFKGTVPTDKGDKRCSFALQEELKFLHRNTPPTFEERALSIAAAANGLEHLHSHGLVHGDARLDNCLSTLAGRPGGISDFGETARFEFKGARQAKAIGHLDMSQRSYEEQLYFLLAMSRINPEFELSERDREKFITGNEDGTPPLVHPEYLPQIEADLEELLPLCGEGTPEEQLERLHFYVRPEQDIFQLADAADSILRRFIRSAQESGSEDARFERADAFIAQMKDSHPANRPCAGAVVAFFESLAPSAGASASSASAGSA